MSVFDKLMSSMRIDDEFDDEEEFEEEDYEYEEKAPKKSFFSKNEFNDDEEEDEEIQQRPSLFRRNPQPAPTHSRKTMEVSLIRPTEIEDAKEITDYLLQGKAVVLNMEGLRTDMAQRIIDFTCGATYAIDGKLQKIANYIFIATPSQVDLTGDFQDMIAGSFSLTGNSFKM